MATYPHCRISMRWSVYLLKLTIIGMCGSKYKNKAHLKLLKEIHIVPQKMCSRNFGNDSPSLILSKVPCNQFFTSEIYQCNWNSMLLRWGYYLHVNMSCIIHVYLWFSLFSEKLASMLDPNIPCTCDTEG